MIELQEETQNAERTRKADEERESERRHEVVLLYLWKHCEENFTL